MISVYTVSAKLLISSLGEKRKLRAARGSGIIATKYLNLGRNVKHEQSVKHDMIFNANAKCLLLTRFRTLRARFEWSRAGSLDCKCLHAFAGCAVPQLGSAPCLHVVTAGLRGSSLRRSVITATIQHFST